MDGLFLYPAARNGITGLLRAWRIGAMLCRRHRFDVVSVQGPDILGCIGFLLARRFRIPFQLQIHTDVMSPWYRRASWKERAQYYLARFLIPRADCVRVVSERIRRSISSKFQVPSSKFSVLPIYTDVSKFVAASADPATEQRFAEYDFKMVAAGRLVEKEKNFSLLIDVMCDFVKTVPRALLVIVGAGPDRKKYESRIGNYGLEKNVILEPWRDDIPFFLKSFDLFLLSSNYEGWNRGVVEAMAAGLPVVMTDVGLAGEVVKNNENGIVVPVGNTKAFGAAAANLYRDPARRAALAVAAVQSVRELTPKTKEEYLALYLKIFHSCRV